MSNLLLLGCGDTDALFISPPPAPTNLAATGGVASVALTWTASIGAATYNLYRGLTPGGESGTPVATGITGTFITDSGLSSSTAYYYKLKAVNGAGTSAASAEVNAQTYSNIAANIASLWEAEENPGDTAMDSKDGNVLSDQNVVGRAAGKIGSAFSFTSASSQMLTRKGSTALNLQLGGTGWWQWAWVWFNTLPVANAKYGILCKGDGNGTEYLLQMYNNSGSLFQVELLIRNTANSTTTSFYKQYSGGTGSWHLLEWAYDDVGQTINLGIDNSAWSSTAYTAGVRSGTADLYLGALSNVNNFMNGLIGQPSIRKQFPTTAERNTIWNGGAGSLYPFVPTTLSGTFTATLDNTNGAAIIPAGKAVPLWLPLTFPWSQVAHANGGDLRAKDGSNNPLALWQETFDRSNQYGRVWIQAPAGGVGVGATAPITITTGTVTNTIDPTAYGALFSKRVADANTLALFQCDTVTAGSTASTVNGYNMTLTGSPTAATQDGGNFRVRTTVQRFSTGSFLTLNGTTQYGTIATLLDTMPAAGSVSMWFRLESSPVTAGARIFSKITSFTGSTVNEGLEILFFAANKLSLRMTKAGVATEALFEYGGAYPAGVWSHLVASWGTRLTLQLDGCMLATGALTGACASGTAAAACVGASFLAAASNFAPISVDEIEVRNLEPSHADILSWFNRSGLVQTQEYARWTRSTSNPVLTATLSSEQNAVFEPHLRRLGAGNYIGVYTGGNSASSLYGMTSTDGKVLVKSGLVPVLGNGHGGESGNACRGNLFLDGGSLYLFYSDSIPTTGGNINYATSSDGGSTWTKQGIVLAPDANHTGFANTQLVKVGSVYHLFAEFLPPNVGQVYHTSHYTSSSLTSGYTAVDDVLVNTTMQMGLGSFSVGGVIYANSKFHMWTHCSKVEVLPSAIFHFVSEDGNRWQGANGYDPVIDLAEQGVLPRQDQVADACTPYVNDSGEVCILYDIDDNHGGGLAARICLSTFVGSLTDLTSEYPSLHG